MDNEAHGCNGYVQRASSMHHPPPIPKVADSTVQRAAAVGTSVPMHRTACSTAIPIVAADACVCVVLYVMCVVCM